LRVDRFAILAGEAYRAVARGDAYEYVGSTHLSTLCRRLSSHPRHRLHRVQIPPRSRRVLWQ